VLVGSWQRGIGRPAGYTMIGLYVAYVAKLIFLT
jgi:hypothetical protein